MRGVAIGAAVFLAIVLVAAGIGAAFGVGQGQRGTPPWQPSPTVFPLPTVIVERPVVATATPLPTAVRLAAPFGGTELWIYNDPGMARDIPRRPASDREAILKVALAGGAACAIPPGESARATVLQGDGELVRVRVEEGSCARFNGWLPLDQ